MKTITQRGAVTVLAYGILSISAILLSGCGTPGRMPMSSMDLDNFQVDCKQRDAQIRFLTSQLSNRDDQFMARLNSVARPWEAITDPGTHQYRQDVGWGRTNWLIRQNILILQTQC